MLRHISLPLQYWGTSQDNINTKAKAEPKYNVPEHITDSATEHLLILENAPQDFEKRVEFSK